MQYKEVHHMARPKKDGVYINYYIPKDIKDRLDKYCEKLDKLIQWLLNEY